MDPYHYSCIKLFTFSLPLFCFLSWSWGASSTTTPFLPPPSSALLAADILRTRGYSLFASLIVSFSTTANFSGTLLVPPDFAFSFAAAKFLNNRRPPPRPSISLLLYHTLKPPLVLTWPTLSSRDDGDELRTLYNNNCLYLFRSSYGGEISISSSPFKNPMIAVKIRQPDLYVDEHLTVHGIDGVLDPSFATKCSVPYADPMADAVPRQVNRTVLDRAMRALRRTGYNVVSAAMAIRRSELLSLTSVTVFAVSDENLFLKAGGFRYDFRHHVVPMRHRFADLAKLTAGGMELDTLAPNKTVLVDSVDGAVNVDGVAVDATEVYHNRWIVVVSVMTSLDDVVGSRGNQPITGAASDNSAPSPAPLSGVSANGNIPRVPSPAPANVGETENGTPSFISNGSTDVNSVGTPSPASELDGGTGDDTPSINTTSSPSPAPENQSGQNSVSSPTPSPAIDDVSDTHCDLNAVVSIGEEGGDLLCPVSAMRQLGETEILSGADVEKSKPLDAYTQVTGDLTQSDKVKIGESVNIADDVFFYI
ncbi:hypothetical protein Pfo_001565 [Paulownia fortunei]|nr:hypothetical protein Pfo_001565 [Paulownia fortunei]